jgi:hypothetical protein
VFGKVIEGMDVVLKVRTRTNVCACLVVSMHVMCVWVVKGQLRCVGGALLHLGPRKATVCERGRLDSCSGKRPRSAANVLQVEAIGSGSGTPSKKVTIADSGEIKEAS